MKNIVSYFHIRCEYGHHHNLALHKFPSGPKSIADLPNLEDGIVYDTLSICANMASQTPHSFLHNQYQKLNCFH